MKLKGKVHLAMDGTMTFSSEVFDGHPFAVAVLEHQVELNDSFRYDRTEVNGWLFVDQEAQQDERCYLTLPSPSIQFGKQVLVRATQLMPRIASLSDFRPQRVTRSDAKSMVEKAIRIKGEKPDTK